jgi:hypothetical protein
VYLSNERLIADAIPPLSIPLEKIEGCTVAKEIPLFTTTVAGIVQTVKRKAIAGERLYIYADVEGRARLTLARVPVERRAELSARRSSRRRF